MPQEIIVYFGETFRDRFILVNRYAEIFFDNRVNVFLSNFNRFWIKKKKCRSVELISQLRSNRCKYYNVLIPWIFVAFWNILYFLKHFGFLFHSQLLVVYFWTKYFGLFYNLNKNKSGYLDEIYKWSNEKQNARFF